MARSTASDRAVEAAARAVGRRRFADVLHRHPEAIIARTQQGHLVAATPARSIDGGVAQRDNLDLVVAACQKADAEYFVLHVPCEPGTRVGVPAGAAARVLHELLDQARGSLLHVQPLGVQDDGRVVLADAAELSTLQKASSWLVFAPRALGSGEYVFAEQHGCRLEAWAESDGALTAPSATPYTTAVPAEDRAEATITVGGVAYRTLRPFSVPRVTDVTFPIDAVYTWVDGTDEEWLQRKAAAYAAVGLGTLHQEAANRSRFLSRDELRYSLRSLEMFAPWVRRIFLVTDGQVPSWLHRHHPRLQVVDHREIFSDTAALPTFNSHAIETRLHHIEGLSEHYLYLNDDVFFGRPVSPDLFFLANGLSAFFLSEARVDLGPPSAADPPVCSAAKNNRALVAEDFGRLLVQKLKHTPIPQRRSILREIEDRYAEPVTETSRHQFRDPRDVSLASSLYHYYAFSTGRAVPGSIRYLYADICARDTPLRLRRLLRRRDLDTFCLNDTDAAEADLPDQLSMLTEFLASYFPSRSTFELDERCQPRRARWHARTCLG
jgi:hypothetical protein